MPTTPRAQVATGALARGGGPSAASGPPALERPAIPSRRLVTGSVHRHLAALTGTLTLGVLGVMAVGVVDAYLLGRLGPVALAAAGFIFPVAMAAAALGIGLAVGASAVIARARGAGDGEAVARLSGHALTLALTLGVVTSLGLSALQGPLFTALNTPPAVRPLVLAYTDIWFAGLPLLMVIMAANALLRAAGDALWPGLILVIQALINVGLAPLLILGWEPIPALGIRGAATATVLAWTLGTTMMLTVVLYARGLVRLADLWRPGLARSARSILAISVPATLTNMINPAGMAIVTGLIASFGTDALAGFSAAGRVEALLGVPLLGLSGAIGPLVGQNLGAGRLDRVAQAVRASLIACTLYGVAAALLLLAVRGPVADVFAEGDGVAARAALYLALVPWSLAGFGITIALAGALNAAGQPLVAAAISLLRMAVLLPAVAIGAFGIGSLEAAFLGVALANWVGAALAWAGWRLARHRLTG